MNIKVNSSDAYTPSVREYDKSMLGLFGMFSPVSEQVGVNRSSVLNPKISSTRGFIDKFDPKTAPMDQLFGPSEMLNIFTPNHSDSPRVDNTSPYKTSLIAGNS